MTICARVQAASGLNTPKPVPVVMRWDTAHATARGIVFVSTYICKATVTSCGLTICSPEEGNDLCTRDSCVGAEGLRAGTVGDAVFNSPQDGGIEVIIRTDIGEGVRLRSRLRASSCSPEEGHNLRTRAGGVRAEGIAACTGSDSPIHSPLDSIVEVIPEQLRH